MIKIKYIKPLCAVLLCIMLTGCGNSEKQVQKDIENQLASIKVGETSFDDFDMYERMNVKDTKIDVDDINNTNLPSIFSDMEYSVESISVNKSTAIANIELTVKDIDTILSDDTVVSDLILDYSDYYASNPNADREDVDLYLLNELCEIIQNSRETSTTIVTVNVYYSSDTDKWTIAYDDDFLDALLGTMEKDYSIDFNDICEEESEQITISYDYNKLLNLPDSNKSTRSSIKNPVSLNEEAVFDNSDYFFEKERYVLKLKLLDIKRGTNALNILNAYPDNIETLDSGTEYILFKVSVKLENNLTSNKEVQISSTDFSLLDENGHYYNNCIVFGLDELEPIAEGETTTGYVCFTIDKNVKPYLLFKDYMDNTICFSN